MTVKNSRLNNVSFSCILLERAQRDTLRDNSLIFSSCCYDDTDNDADGGGIVVMLVISDERYGYEYNTLMEVMNSRVECITIS